MSPLSHFTEGISNFKDKNKKSRKGSENSRLLFTIQKLDQVFVIFATNYTLVLPLMDLNC